MSLKSDDNTLQQKDLVFILAIAGRIDAQTRQLALSLDKNRNVYHAYAVFDSLSSSYSMFKYFFDVFIGGNSDSMHELMLTPAGIIGISVEAIFLVSFSFLASLFEKEEAKDNETNYKALIAMSWPYVREVIKGLKNAYKGWRSTVAVINLLGGSANFLLLPVGLSLGVLGLINRCLIRAIKDSRKAMMTSNGQLLCALSKLPSLMSNEFDVFLKEQGYIKYQKDEERYWGFLYSGIGGLVDGLYLYVGALTLATLAPQLLIGMVVLCAFYTLGCIITRIYEEHEYQQMLMITHTQISIVAAVKQIQTLYLQLLLAEEKIEQSQDDLSKIAALREELSDLIDQLENKQKLLRQQTGKTVQTSLLLGLKHGLYAYSAVSSILFFVSTVAFIMGASLPPAAVVVAISLGALLIASYMAHALLLLTQQKPKEEYRTGYNKLLLMKKEWQGTDECAYLSYSELNESLECGMLIAGFSRQKSTIQEGYEVVRSSFSGLAKGQKFLGFMANPLQEIGEDGHYHDTPIMFYLSAVSAFIFGTVLGLRALARGCRPPLDDSREVIDNIFVKANERCDIDTSDYGLSTDVREMKRSISFENVQRVSPLGMFSKGRSTPSPGSCAAIVLEDDKVVGLN